MPTGPCSATKRSPPTIVPWSPSLQLLLVELVAPALLLVCVVCCAGAVVLALAPEVALLPSFPPQAVRRRNAMYAAFDLTPHSGNGRCWGTIRYRGYGINGLA